MGHMQSSAVWALFACLCFDVISPAPAAESEETPGDRLPADMPSEEKLLDIYYDFMAKVKPYGLPTDREEHQEALNPKIRGWVANDSFLGSELAVTVGSSKAMVDVDVHSGMVLRYSLRYLYDPAGGMQEEYAPGNIHPSLSEAEAIEKVKPCLSLNTRIKFDNYKANAEYEGNLWYITFRRRLGEYVYERDRIVIYYSEKYGLLSYRNSLYSDECDTDAKITEEEAKELARKYVKNLAQKLKGREEFASREDGRFIIVNPATYETVVPGRIDLEPIPLEEARKTRLAWRESFENETIGMRVFICVDAITGKLLCYKTHMR